jgi:hypothetical protein
MFTDILNNETEQKMMRKEFGTLEPSNPSLLAASPTTETLMKE